MMNRTLRRCLRDIQIPSSTLPPTFLLPSRTRYFNSTTQIVDSPPDHGFQASQIPIPATESTSRSSSTPKILSKIPSKPEISNPVSLSESIRTLLPLLASQPGHFISAHIHDRPYLITKGDTIRLPFLMPGVIPGDVIRLNRASSLGSRDYTLKAGADKKYLDERLFECRATVLGVDAEPMRLKEKTKRRNRRINTVKSKHKFTILRVSEVRVKGLEEIEMEAGGL